MRVRLLYMFFHSRLPLYRSLTAGLAICLRRPSSSSGTTFAGAPKQVRPSVRHRAGEQIEEALAVHAHECLNYPTRASRRRHWKNTLNIYVGGYKASLYASSEYIYIMHTRAFIHIVLNRHPFTALLLFRRHVDTSRLYIYTHAHIHTYARIRAKYRNVDSVVGFWTGAQHRGGHAASVLKGAISLFGCIVRGEEWET